MKNSLIFTDKEKRYKGYTVMQWIFIVYNVSLIPLIYIYSYTYLYIDYNDFDAIREARSWGRECILNYSPFSLFFECERVFLAYFLLNFFLFFSFIIHIN